MSEVQRIPEGFHTLTPHIVVKNAKKALEFYQKAFGARIVTSMPVPGNDDQLMHAEIQIGSSRLMLADEFPAWGVMGPGEAGSPVTLHLYVEDADAAMQKAVDAGAELVMPLQDMFWGDRYGKLKDPFGHSWSIAHHFADPTEEEMAAAMAASMPGGDCG